MMKTEDAFLEEIAQHLDYWVNAASEAVGSDEADLIWTDNPEAFRALRRAIADTGTRAEFEAVLRETLRGFINSTLTTFDGGTALAEQTSLSIRDAEGHTLPDHLHELFVDHLLRTGRLD